jgi:Protein of unknown function (DUF2752)
MPQSSSFAPVLSPILCNRKLGLLISVVAFLQVSLAVLGLPAWQCPFFHLTGIPCPGCGLTRATLLLLHGDWRQSLALHAFAPLFLFALLILAFVSFLPAEASERVGTNIEWLERRTGFTSLVLFALILYWLARLLILQTAFVHLIRG